MDLRFVSILACAAVALDISKADAAVFRLKNVAFTADGGSSNYSISGEFKVNTSASSDLKLTDWNLEVVKSGSPNIVDVFTYNTSASASTPGDENSFTICQEYTCTTQKSLTMTFANKFNEVYLDPWQGVDVGSGVGNGTRLLNSTNLNSVVFTGAVSPSVTAGSQADFVPFSPFAISILPVFSVFKRFARSRNGVPFISSGISWNRSLRVV